MSPKIWARESGYVSNSCSRQRLTNRIVSQKRPQNPSLSEVLPLQRQRSVANRVTDEDAITERLPSTYMETEAEAPEAFSSFSPSGGTVGETVSLKYLSMCH
jgi:hypothetical protein